ncbi:aspartic proteinase nepenthesin-1-like [Triticum dicoccoides]|uniref:aspartic proteinase nepenthesin-1-like n=1 Tax=Triticum dicoccoides TaxID=85692 RepID=UPI000E7D0C88|nr:aspartic proteinase nepenthesin-1-like [Triticum dicoccoides]
MATACSLPPLVLLLLLLLVGLPLSSAAVRPPPQVGRFFARAVGSIIKKSTKEYLQDRAKDSVRDFSSQGNTGKQGNNDQLGSSAADKFGAFFFDLSVGTPSSPRTISLVLDITSELVWTQCVGLQPTDDTFVQIGCDDQKCKDVFPDDTTCAAANPDDACAANLGRPCCGYQETFYGGGGTKGNLATETFTFGSTPVTDFVFGCSDSDTVLNDLDSGTGTGSGASGFAGFSTGPLSLVSQLQISSFSYFIALPDDPDKDKSFISWGDATPKGGLGTPLLVPTPSQSPHWYYVKLTGVQVDGQLLSDIPAGTFDVNTDGAGGVFLSTTLPVTYLEQAAYNVLRQELVSKIQSKGVSPTNPDDENHLCFDKQSFADKEVPKLALVFDGADAVMELKVQNYFFTLDNEMTCLAILPSTGGSVLGSLLQTGRTMTYDLQHSMLTFGTFETAAAAPAPAKVQLMIMATLLLWVLLQF